MINNFGVSGKETHYWITTRDGRVINHSQVVVRSPNDSITKAEFSDQEFPLDDELINSETEIFNQTFLPLYEGLKSTKLVKFRKNGHLYLAALSPMRAKYYENEFGEIRYDTRLVYTQVTDKESYLISITDKSALVLSLIIWGIIFTVVIIFIVFLSILFLAKVVNRALRPIKILNLKVSNLLAFGDDSSLENTKVKMTSSEARKMYEVFSQLITARRFASNKIMYSSNAVAIMEYAEAYTVFRGNQRVQGICMANIGHSYFKLGDYEKATKSYLEAADYAKGLVTSPDCTKQEVLEYKKLYCQRKYYATVASYNYLRSLKPRFTEEKILAVSQQLSTTKKLIENFELKSMNDILIILNLYSSRGLLMTRRLISAEKALKIAVKLFNK